SCWVRVSHPWAGAGFGGIHIPRIGQEVLVDHLNGDPDRPIITSRVYNAFHMPPWGLPANATQSGFLTRSSMGAGYDNANALRFEDKKGQEQLYIHAERNQDIVVKNDETHAVGHNRTKSVASSETATIGEDRLRAVKRDDVLLVGASRSESVSQNYVLEVGEKLRLVCGESVLELNASGQINLTGVAINFHATGDAEFNTGGLLNLNIGGGPGATPDGQGDKGSIDKAINSIFPKG
ncbi:MAG: type VI secretion system tip protein TssI/VgrG, partial [Pseudomonas sp.]|uniref:type VI secretion system Vgr family protein n=1 Tax=Pseudomonas sp. TaxID=306 RepID=UPI0033913D0F